MVGEVKGVDLVGMRVAVRGMHLRRGTEGTERRRLRLTLIAVALAMMCPTLVLRLLKKAARVAKTQRHSLGWAALADL